MNRTTQDRLLCDALFPDALAASLGATRRAARARRIRRRVVQGAVAACVVFAMLWQFGVLTRLPGRDAVSPIVRGADIQEAPVVARISVPSFAAVVTTAEFSPATVRTSPEPAHFQVSTKDFPNTAGDLVVTTQDSKVAIPSLTESDLFALAGGRPAALHHLPDGSARWMWVAARK